MNIETGELFENREAAIQDMISKGVPEEKAEELLVPLCASDYKDLKGMNRAQRRRWAREHKKDKKEIVRDERRDGCGERGSRRAIFDKRVVVQCGDGNLYQPDRINSTGLKRTLWNLQQIPPTVVASELF